MLSVSYTLKAFVTCHLANASSPSIPCIICGTMPGCYTFPLMAFLNYMYTHAGQPLHMKNNAIQFIYCSRNIWAEYL